MVLYFLFPRIDETKEKRCYKNRNSTQLKIQQNELKQTDKLAAQKMLPRLLVENYLADRHLVDTLFGWHSLDLVNWSSGDQSLWLLQAMADTPAD